MFIYKYVLIGNMFPEIEEVLFEGTLDEVRRVYNKLDFKENYAIASYQSYLDKKNLLPNLRFKLLKQEQTKLNVRPIKI